MRRFVLTVLATAVLSLPLFAETATFNVPFEFAVGNTTVTPGQYLMRYNAGSPSVQMVGVDQHASYFVSTRWNGRNSTLEPRLVFRVYGNQYFLSQIWIGSAKTDVPETRVERELQKTNIASSQHILMGTH